MCSIRIVLEACYSYVEEMLTYEQVAYDDTPLLILRLCGCRHGHPCPTRTIILLCLLLHLYMHEEGTEKDGVCRHRPLWLYEAYYSYVEEMLS